MSTFFAWRERESERERDRERERKKSLSVRRAELPELRNFSVGQCCTMYGGWVREACIDARKSCPTTRDNLEDKTESMGEIEKAEGG
jgi:hypothetical protein